MVSAASSLQPQDIAALQRAFELLRTGRHHEALQAACALVLGLPHAPDVHHLLALSLAETGDLPGAAAAFERTLAMAPPQAPVLSNYASLLRRAGRASDALGPALQATQVASKSAKAWLELATTAQLAGDAALARRAAQRSLELESDGIAALQALGQAARSQEDHAAAGQAFARVLAKAPTQRQAWLSLGDSQRRAGRADLSIATYAKARAYIDSPELDDALAGAMLDTGRVDEALAQARRLTEDHPQFIGGWTTLANLAWEYAEAGACEAELKRFRDAVATQPDNTALQAALTGFLLATRQGEAALVHAQRLYAESPRPAFALLEAQALALVGQHDAAGRLHASLQAAGGGRDPVLLNAYARHQLHSGRPELASELASIALRLDPHNQEAWAYLSTAWRLLDDPREHWLCDYARLVGFVEVEPPPGYAGIDAFLHALQRVLQPLHRARREPMQQSLRGGSQTPGRLFGRDDKVLDDTQAALAQAVRGWIAGLPSDPAHPFLGRKRRDVRIGGSWSVKLWSSGRHANHIHSEGWMSSAFYVALPPSVIAADGDGDGASPTAGAIQFGQPPDELGLGLPPRRVIQPRPGMLALFPSYLWHGTISFDDAQPRITIAFDMIPGDDA